jgi:hypothetical protein
MSTSRWKINFKGYSWPRWTCRIQPIPSHTWNGSLAGEADSGGFN